MLISSILIIFSSCETQKKLTGTVNQVNREIVNVHLPSVSYLYKLYFIIYESKELTKSWAYVYKSDDAIDKVRLKDIHSKVYPDLKKHLDELKKSWNPKERKAFHAICKRINKLFEKEQEVMNQLNSYEAYEDVMIVFQVDHTFERGTDSITTETEEILKALNRLISEREAKLKGIVNDDEKTEKKVISDE